MSQAAALKQPCSSPPQPAWEPGGAAVHVGPHQEDTERNVGHNEGGAEDAAPAVTQQALYLPSLWQQSAGDGLQWLQL